MNRYRVVLVVDCTISVEVDADTPELAMEAAYESAQAPSLCHRCADHFEIGDVMEPKDEMLVTEIEQGAAPGAKQGSRSS